MATIAAVLEAKLRDKQENQTGQHRCWASINNKDDQLYKISRELFKFASGGLFRLRSMGTNEQRVSAPLRTPELDRETESPHWGEKRIPQLKKLEAGIVLLVIPGTTNKFWQTQKQNFRWFGWKTPEA